MRTLFGTWASRLAGVSAIAGALLGAAAVSAQTRFEAIDYGAIHGAPALQVVTIRDNTLKACYLVFLTERAHPPSGSVSVDAPLPDIAGPKDVAPAPLMAAAGQNAKFGAQLGTMGSAAGTGAGAAINFFGIRDKSSSVVIMIDVSDSMFTRRGP